MATEETLREFAAYQQALAERGPGLVFDCHVPGEFHRYHYHGKQVPGFYIIAAPDGTVQKFFPRLIFH